MVTLTKGLPVEDRSRLEVVFSKDTMLEMFIDQTKMSSK
jgi:hypothetical protein